MAFAFICATPAKAQQAAEPGVTSNKTLGDIERRVFFDATPFSSGPVPYWDKGFLVSMLTVEVIRPETPTVRLYDANGNKVKEVALWFPGPERIYLHSAAVTQDGRIAVSGVAVKSDGTRASYIAVFDNSGKVSNVIQTNPFFPSGICFAPDNTIWSFGSVVRAPDEPMLRQFDVEKGQIASFLPRSSFKGRSDPSSLGGFGQAVFLRCTPSRVVIYTEVADEYIELEYNTKAISRWELDRSQNGLPIHGRIAVTPNAETFAVMREPYGKSSMPWGLFNLQVDRPTGKARWLPVEGQVSDRPDHRMVTNVLGADQNGIVFMTADDWPAVFWAKAKDRK
jgi:hypothetical protein